MHRQATWSSRRPRRPPRPRPERALVARPAARDDHAVWWKREAPAMDWQTVNGIINKLITMDAKLDEILEYLRDDDEED
jgi:hypothetical protein